MPRYYFNVHDGISIADDVGAELPDLKAAQREAVKLSGALLSDSSVTFWTGEEWHMDVTDNTGLILFTLTFVATRAASTTRLRPHS